MTLSIPLYLHRAIGVHVGAHAVRWVELRRTRGEPRVVTADEEPIRDGDLPAALAALKTRCRPSSPSVATHLDPLHVRHTTPATPPPDEAIEAGEWAGHQLQKALSAPADPDAFAVRVQLLPGEQDAPPCALAFARREAVAERARAFDAAGLSPVSVTSLPATAARTVGGAGHVWVLVLDGEDALLVEARDGVVLDAEPLGPVAAGTALEEADGRLAALSGAEAPRKVLLTTDGLAADVSERAALTGWATTPLPLGVHALPNEYTVAATLALDLLNRNPTLDFLPPEEARRRRMQREREAATSYALGIGVALLLVLATLLCGEAYLGVRSRALAAELSAVAPQLAVLQQAEAERDRLQVAAARVAGESDAPSAVRTLAALGRLVPERIWLTVLALETDSSGARLALEGLTRDDGAVTILLDRMEQSSAFDRVRLDVTGSAARMGGGYRPDLDPDLQQFRVAAVPIPRHASTDHSLAASAPTSVQSP